MNEVKPLSKKLGLKPGFRCYVFAEPDEYLDWLHPIPEEIEFNQKLSGEFDFLHGFFSDVKVFERHLILMKKFQKQSGMIWISWPKKASKFQTDIDENRVRDFALQNGLVDVKVCAVNEVWSGLKLVIRVRDRK